MIRRRRAAPARVRRLIAKCLKEKNFRIFPDGQRFLDLHELNAEAVVEDLAAEIDQFEIFVLPKQQPAARQKYDYVIRYVDPTLLVYDAKMTPADGDPPVVFLSFHRHNVPGEPLPRIPAQDTDETD